MNEQGRIVQQAEGFLFLVFNRLQHSILGKLMTASMVSFAKPSLEQGMFPPLSNVLAHDILLSRDICDSRIN